MEKFSRTSLLIGKDGLEKLNRAHVALFGVGGVGGFVAEALVRSGVGNITLFDSDTVSLSNINRQIIADTTTVNQYKTEVMARRLKDINPNVNVYINNVFYLPENAQNYPLNQFDYVVDAIDTVSGKIALICQAKGENVKVISCMGMGGKVDITAIKTADIYKTKECALARVMRRELKKRGIENLKVVYSTETPLDVTKNLQDAGEEVEKRASGRVAPPSMIFVPAAAGLMIAKEVVFDLINEK